MGIEQRPGREPEAYPPPGDPLMTEGSATRQFADRSKAALDETTEADIDALLGSDLEQHITVHGRAEKRLQDDTLGEITRAAVASFDFPHEVAAKAAQADQMDANVATLAAAFREQFGQSIADVTPSELESHGPKALALAKRHAGLREFATRLRREQRLFELRSHDAAAYAAIEGLQSGLKQTAMDALREYGVSPDPSSPEHDTARHAELMAQDEKYRSLARRFNEGRLQLDRLEKENGLA